MQDGKGNEAELAKLRAELATLGVAAKEGVAAASKVKGLETDNKKLLEENKVLTENFNSERVCHCFSFIFILPLFLFFISFVKETSYLLFKSFSYPTLKGYLGVA